MKRKKNCLLITLVLITSMMMSFSEVRASQYEITSQLIEGLIPYIQWIKREPTKPTFPFICTLGFDPVFQQLKALHKDDGFEEKIIKKSIKSDFSDCHILYVSASEKIRIDDILREVGQMDVLTVSTIEGFAKSGGVVEFVFKAKGISIVINKRPAAENQILLDSGLLLNATAIWE